MNKCPYCSHPGANQTRPVEKTSIAACVECFNPYAVTTEAGVTDTCTLDGWQDLRVSLQTETIAGEIFRALPKALSNLPVLPEIAQKVMMLTRDAESTMGAFAKVINSDQAIAMKLLHMANSVMYGGLQEVLDIQTACTRLGTKAIANAVQIVANGNLYITGNAAYREFMRKLWRHGVASAQCAYEIASALARTKPESLFVAGLIHDVGKAVLLDIISGTYRGPLGRLRETPDLLQEVLLTSGPLVGLHAVQKWELPAEFAATTFCLRQPNLSPDPEYLSNIHIVALSSMIAEASGYETGEFVTSLVSNPSAKYLGLNDIRIAALRADLDDRLAPLFELGAA